MGEERKKGGRGKRGEEEGMILILKYPPHTPPAEFSEVENSSAANVFQQV
jgi:hypothetical protein